MVTTVMPYAVRRLVVLLAVLAAYSTHWSPTYADGTTTAAPSSSSSTTTADDQDFHNAESSFKSALAIINAAASQPRAIRRAMEVLHDLSLGTGRVSADSLAELALLHLVGVHGTHDFPKAAAYAQRSAALGSPKGRHVHAFILLHGGIGGVARNVTEAWRQEDLAAQQNYHPALLAVGFRDLLAGRCEGALRQYRAAALAAASIVDSSFYGDYPSLRPLTMDQDGLGDGAADKVTEGGNEEGFPWTRTFTILLTIHTSRHTTRLPATWRRCRTGTSSPTARTPRRTTNWAASTSWGCWGFGPTWTRPRSSTKKRPCR
jgi:hypothetical protein